MAQKYDIYVISGPILVGIVHKTIGKGVVVPEKEFKVIYNETLGTTESYILPNAPASVKDLVKYRVQVSDIESATGLVLFPKKVK